MESCSKELLLKEKAIDFIDRVLNDIKNNNVALIEDDNKDAVFKSSQVREWFVWLHFAKEVVGRLDDPS